MDAPRLASFEHQGWQLANAEARSLEFPETFLIPDRRMRESRDIGDLVKLIFEYGADLETERMWVCITERGNGFYVGSLDNVPFVAEPHHGLVLGTLITFQPEHIADLDA